jgi:RNA polymerase sigma-70 factor (ECF subfamily)
VNEPSPPIDARRDEELIAAANAGDLEAFEALYRRYRGWVAALALRFTGDPDLALDVLQETFVYLVAKLPSLQLTARMTTFLYPAVKNLSLAARRKRGRFAGNEEALLAIPDRETTGGPAEDLAGVLSTLPETHREVLWMRFVDEMSLEEIACALGIPLGTVKSRLHNALGTLRADRRTRRYFGLD